MPSFIEKSLSLPHSARLLLVASLGSLAFALVMQYGFGLRPCVLCLWQRVPFAVVTLMTIGISIAKPHKNITALLLALCAAVFLCGMGLAIFHTGVEQHLWLGTSGCAVQPLHGGSPDTLRQSLLQTIAPRCDEVAWTIFGLSMANLNIVWSLTLAFIATASSVHAVQKR